MPINTTTIVRVVAVSCATALVVASAGFGSVYAWNAGSNHGILLAGLSVLFAIALEGIKPLAISQALQSFSQWSPIRGALLALLGLVAVAYSLTAELTLMAGIRGDDVAKREGILRASSQAQERYDQARKELAGIPSARSVSEVQAEIDGLLLTPGADGCIEINGKVTREVCPKVSELRAEKARAERRATLEAVPSPSSTSVEIKAADPGASALATYLGALGIKLAPGLLTEWLALIPVLALELGSSLAGLVVAAGSKPVVHPQDIGKPSTEPSPSKALPRERTALAIVNHLKANGGSLSRSERGLAKLIGEDRNTVRRAIHGLALAGLVSIEAATKTGTLLRLAA